MKWLLIAGVGVGAWFLWNKAKAATLLPTGSVQVQSGTVLGIPYTIYMTAAGYYLNISGITTQGPFSQAQVFAALSLFGNPQSPTT